MTRKQKLRNAVVIGLLMNSVTASSAWAAEPLVDGFNYTDDYFRAAGIYREWEGMNGPASIKVSHDDRAEGVAFGIWSYSADVAWTNAGTAVVNVENIDIDVKNFVPNAGDYITSEAISVGILAGAENGTGNEKGLSKSEVKASKDVNINVLTRNSQNAYGAYAKKNGTVNVNSKDGNISIESSKSLDKKTIFYVPQKEIADTNYNAEVYGVRAVEGEAYLNAEAGNIAINSYIEDVKDLEEYDEFEKHFEELKQGNIYGVSNTNGTVDLKAGTGISIIANSKNGNAYGIYANSAKSTALNSQFNYIESVADGTGLAYGIFAENNVDVDITGDTFIHGDDGALVVKGDLKGDDKVVVKGNLIASANDGAAIILDGASMHVTNNEIINNTLEIKNNSSHTVDESLIGVVKGANAVDVDNSSFKINGNIGIYSDKTGLNILGESNVEILGDGENYIIGDNKGIDLQNDAGVTFGKDSLTRIIANGENSTAVNVDCGEFRSKGSVQVQGGKYGFEVKDMVNINSNTGINYFKATEYREDVVNNDSDFSNAVNVGTGASFNVSGLGNVLEAGEIINGYGSETAISAANENSSVTLNAGYLGNTIGGAIYSNGKNTEINIDSEGDNYIFSSTHGRVTGNDKQNNLVHLVSAVYSTGDSHINISAGEDGVNVIRSYTEFSEEHVDEKTGKPLDREVTVWAEKGGSVNLNGAVFIAASNYGNYTENEMGDPVKSNALGIAVSAGGRELTYNDGELVPVDNISEVNIDYDSKVLGSNILGDVVAGYGGEINIGQNLKGRQSGNSYLNVKGNLLSANSGKLNVDFGNGAYWEGRADDYGDANLENHQSFYNPAFSNDIVSNGEVNVKMKDSYWNVTAQSWLTSFAGDNNIIDMVSYEDNGTHALSIREMTGDNNTFIMGLNHNKHEISDMLYIKGGEANIDIVVNGTIDGLEKVSEENGLRFATIGEGITVGKEENGRRYITGINGGMFNTKLYVKDSAYDSADEDNISFNGDGLDYNKPGNDNLEYFFKSDEDKPQVQLLDLADDIKENVKVDADNWEIVDFEQIGMSDIGKTVLDLSKVNYSNAVYMDRFNKRMGEARFIDGDEGLWVRLRHDRIGNKNSYRSMNTMYEIGYDAKQLKEDGEHRVGFAIDYMDGSSNFSQVYGTGEVSRKGLWIYDSWMGEKGHYRDFVAKWGHLSNDFEFITNAGQAAADFSNNVYSISAEFGKKNDIGNNWYFEPQAQLQYAHVTGAEYTTSMAGNVQSEIKNDSFNSLVARVGFRLGRDISNTSTVYLKGDVMHEFLGDQDVFAKDSTTGSKWQAINYDHGGTWYDIGFGFATALNKNNYAYVDFERAFGNDNDETYQINVGLNWSF